MLEIYVPERMRAKSADKCTVVRRFAVVIALALFFVSCAVALLTVSWRVGLHRTSLANASEFVSSYQQSLTRRREGLNMDRQASAQSGPSCGPRLKYIVVVTYGRSGSTLINGILGNSPGVVMRGENDDYLYGLFTSHQNALKRIQHLQKMHNSTEVVTGNSHPFVGIEKYNSAAVIAAFREAFVCAVLNPPPGTHTIGYKEIRFGHHDDLHEYLDFIRQVLPGVRFVYNSRDHASVSKSGWWRLDGNISLTLSNIQSRLDTERDLHPEDSYQVHYDTYTKNPNVLQGLFEFLKLPFDSGRIKRLLQEQFSIY